MNSIGDDGRLNGWVFRSPEPRGVVRKLYVLLFSKTPLPNLMIFGIYHILLKAFQMCTIEGVMSYPLGVQYRENSEKLVFFFI